MNTIKNKILIVCTIVITIGITITIYVKSPQGPKRQDISAMFLEFQSLDEILTIQTDKLLNSSNENTSKIINLVNILEKNKETINSKIFFNDSGEIMLLNKEKGFGILFKKKSNLNKQEWTCSVFPEVHFHTICDT